MNTYAVAFAPDNPRLVMVALDSYGVFQSQDGGDSWARLDQGMARPVFALACNPAGTRWLAATAGGAWVNDLGPVHPFRHRPRRHLLRVP